MFEKIAFHIGNSLSQLDKSELLILTTILRLRKKKITTFVIIVYVGMINSYESDMYTR